MANPKVSILNFQMGNIHSVLRQFERLSVPCAIIESPKQIKDSDKIILPGVGHFGNAMKILESKGLIEALNEFALVDAKPILGICLGMQLMTESSEEGFANGLGWIKGKLRKFSHEDTLRYKNPHCGWNQLSRRKESLLMKNIPESAEFYFIHSYFLPFKRNDSDLTTTSYGVDFVSAFEEKNIFGVQFHPEKSHTTGLRLLKNFVDL